MKTIHLTPEQVGAFTRLAEWHKNTATETLREIATGLPSLGRANELRTLAARHEHAAKHINDILRD